MNNWFYPPFPAPLPSDENTALAHSPAVTIHASVNPDVTAKLAINSVFCYYESWTSSF
ncbi:MAG: hypothetical protein LBH75_01355 [Treponema sp.]|nr:hypothetical protein [Treponema sp.]